MMKDKQKTASKQHLRGSTVKRHVEKITTLCIVARFFKFDKGDFYESYN
jgi:hypothetical protein